MAARSEDIADLFAEAYALSRILPTDVRLVSTRPQRAPIADLQPQEAAAISDASLERRREFAAGRRCAHAALAGLDCASGPLLPRPDGSPDWPDAIRGSITHKAGRCIAVAARVTAVTGIGIDLEPAAGLPEVTWPAVLYGRERNLLRALPSRKRAVYARTIFSVKESYYKWYGSGGGTLDPGFHDVEVTLLGDTAICQPVGTKSLPAVRGHVVRGARWIVTAVWSMPREPTLDSGRS